MPDCHSWCDSPAPRCAINAMEAAFPRCFRFVVKALSPRQVPPQCGRACSWCVPIAR
ncbi:hypothetical protein ACFFX0_15770 [Citricoccus parietis]|uniref:Uncharacterized protein n=1 Tax=Citricoccus parietis TaxID=592307 RepID=A0ABV5G0W8_9MICC